MQYYFSGKNNSITLKYNARSLQYCLQTLSSIPKNLIYSKIKTKQKKKKKAFIGNKPQKQALTSKYAFLAPVKLNLFI
jgi:hypothetical protein